MKTYLTLFTLILLGLTAALSDSDAGQPKTKKKIVPGKTEIKPALPPLTKVTDKVPIVTILPGKKKTGDVKMYMRAVQDNSGKWKMDAGQKGALDKLLGQQSLTDNDRQQLSKLLFDGQQAGLSRDDERALSELLLDETARQTPADPTAAGEPPVERSGPWFLRIHNNTGEQLKVWVQVVPELTEKKDDKEAKATPAKLDTLVYNLETGKAYDLQREGKRIQASALRVWAISPTRNWVEHKEQELRLTTPPNQSKTYLLTFSK